MLFSIAEHEILIREYSGVYPAESLLSPKDINRKARFIHQEDKDRLYASRILLAEHLKETGISVSLPLMFSYGKYDRPQLPYPYPRFNISHSGQLVACSTNEYANTGVDIEKITDLPEDILTKVCTQNEITTLSNYRNELDKAIFFFFLWTAKESLMKACGLGLQMNPTEINIEITASLDYERRVMSNSTERNFIKLDSVQLLKKPETLHPHSITWKCNQIYGTSVFIALTTENYAFSCCSL
ncbi:MAG: 4'-phosphopantetheinyl transferase superfamily protein [Balneolales bacterium]|nr:4'-phosphopantetheinyl transferase superfamily protein [Balneolales bacterium]